MDRTVSRLQAIARLSEAVSRARESAEVCEAALDCVRQELGIERSAVLVLDTRGSMRVRAARGLSEPLRAAVEGVSPWAPDERDPAPLLLPDAAGDPRLAAACEAIRAEGLARLACVPLRARGRVVGKLMLADGPGTHDDPEWLRLVTALADIIALALDGHRAQERLREVNGLLTALMESVPEAMGFIDTHGRFVYVTRRIEAFFGVPADRMTGLDAPGVLGVIRDHLVDPDTTLVQVEAAMKVGRADALELRHIDGRVFELTSVPATVPGSLEGHVVQLRDVTQRREFEARLLHAHTMESIGRLAGGVAHDFNNMLTAMIGYMDLVASGLPPEAEEHAYLAQALEAAVQASGLTSQLLAFARRQPVEPSAQDVNALLERMAPLLRRLVPENIRIETRFGAHPGWVLADAGQLEHVLVNLAFNARDAMPDGGTLTLTTSRERSAALAGGEAVVLEVGDTGVGMDAETRARVFEPFYTTKPGGLGAGLGLATVYGIVQQFGGTVEVQSEPGRGARFRVLLPPTPGPAAAPATDGGVPRGHETVMLVEDDPSVRGLVTAMLGRLGYVVLAADRADEALEVLERHVGEVHLLIADIVMPGMSGRALATRALAARPQMRVLLTSGHAAGGAGGHATDFAFMPKPFSIETLARRVRETLAAPPPSVAQDPGAR